MREGSKICSKNPHCVRHNKEDDKAILYPPLHPQPPRINITIYGVDAEAWVPLELAVYIAWLNHGGSVWTGMTSYT